MGYELIDFINKSPVSFYAIENVKKLLLDSGYKEVEENKYFDVKPGDKLFFVRNNSTLVGLIVTIFILNVRK